MNTYDVIIVMSMFLLKGVCLCVMYIRMEYNF